MRAFFEQTRDAASEFGALFDFIWVSVPALWNLRWQVRGFLGEVPSASSDDLKARFVHGSETHGSNLRRACIDTTWEEQTERFAAVVLTNAFAIYEHWADEIIITLGVSGSVSGKDFQFPDTPSRAGLPSTVAHLCRVESATLKKAYYSVLIRNAKYSWQFVSSQLLCYRYFKEARNSLFHHGGQASKRAQTASAAFLALNSSRALGIKGALQVEPLVEGKVFKLHLRAVVGFCDVLWRLMHSVDAELARSKYAEDAFEKMLRRTVSKSGRNTLPEEMARRNARVVRRCNAADFLRPKTQAPFMHSCYRKDSCNSATMATHERGSDSPTPSIALLRSQLGTTTQRANLRAY